MLSINRRLKIALLLLLMLVVTIDVSSSQPRISSRQVPPASRFIVAFELYPEKGFKCTWPYESTPPSAYDSVLMLVENMPRVVDRDGRQRVLRPSECLEVNGRLLKPPPNVRQANQRQQFEVKLSQGRLRFSLTVPQGVALDRQYRTVRVKLYQLSKP
jgi:hypothetical protein